MANTIKLKRNSTASADLTAAQTLLDTLTFQNGEPILIRYMDSTVVKALLAIGTGDGVGSDYYQIISGEESVLTYIAEHAAEYNAHPTAAGGTNFGLSQQSYSTAEKNKLASIVLGTSSGNVPTLDSGGKLPESTIPAVAISDTFEVATQAAMLALTAQVGDVAIRSDENKSYILKASPATTLSNWIWLRTPTDAVLSFNSRTGAITLSKADVEGALTGAITTHTHAYQPVDADLTAIAGLSGTSGFLKKTAANTWSLDTNTYLTGISKALVEGVLTGDISTHTHSSYITSVSGLVPYAGATGNVDLNTYNFNAALVSGDTLESNGDVLLGGSIKKGALTYTMPAASGTLALTSQLPGSQVYPGAGIPLSTGSAWGTSITNNSSNWNTAYTDRLKWDGGSTGLTATTGRTSLGATTVGSNLFTLTNPSAIRFLRVNADNTVSSLDAASFRTAIGAGTSSSSGVTSVAVSVPTGLSISGSPITTTGTLAITLTSGYTIPTTTAITNAGTAYGWGNHASAGYLTSNSIIDGGTF